MWIVRAFPACYVIVVVGCGSGWSSAHEPAEIAVPSAPSDTAADPSIHHPDSLPTSPSERLRISALDVDCDSVDTWPAVIPMREAGLSVRVESPPPFSGLVIVGESLGVVQSESPLSRALSHRLWDVEKVVCRWLSADAGERAPAWSRVARNYRRYYRQYRVEGGRVELQLRCDADIGWIEGGPVPRDGGACYVRFLVNSGGLEALPTMNAGGAPAYFYLGHFGARHDSLGVPTDLQELEHELEPSPSPVHSTPGN